MHAFRSALVSLVVFAASASCVEERGTILREYWSGISGTSVASLMSDPRFPASPTGMSFLTSFATVADAADSYGTRVRGLIYPPVSGVYRFWIAGDDNCELWLGATDASASKVLVASVPGWTGPLEWEKYASQRSADVTLVAGNGYYIEALHKEGGGGDSLAVAWEYPGTARQVIPGEFLAPATPIPTPSGGTGQILREYWLGISGNGVAALTSNPAFPQSPTARDYLTAFETPVDWNDSYGTRMRGLLHPTQTGAYRFWIAGDDECQLWLSPNDQPLQKNVVASVPGYTAPREWTKFSQQQSASITLVAGATYYIEALQKEGGGGDSLSVAWTGPGIGDTPVVIAGSFLSPTTTENPGIPTSQGTGSILLETWNDISGNAVTNLTSNAAFPQRPSSRAILTSFKESTNVADSFGSRIRGYVCPAISGTYQFWIASDDEGQLHLSTDESPANVTTIASVPSWTGAENWDQFPQQQSVGIVLVGGQRYYIEALHKEGNGGDHLAVAWSGPSIARGSIEGKYLSPVDVPIIDGAVEFTTTTTVTIAATVTSGTLRYTVDGSAPTAGSTLYSAPFTLSGSAVVRAVHIAANGTVSEIAERVFVRHGTGTGLTAAYYGNEQLLGQAVVRIDPTIDFNWGARRPPPIWRTAISAHGGLAKSKRIFPRRMS